jgi:hypothetical protein
MTTREERNRDLSRRGGEPRPSYSGERCACGSWQLLTGGVGERDRRTCCECGRRWEVDR